MPHSILVIDDDADIRNALQLVLKKGGYCPLLADGGQAAIALMMLTSFHPLEFSPGSVHERERG